MPYLEVVVKMATVQIRENASSLLLELISHTANSFCSHYYSIIFAFTVAQQKQHQHISIPLPSP
jgi:hypothetical protein